MSIKRGTYIVINVKGFTALDLSNDDQTTVHGYPLHGQPNQRVRLLVTQYYTECISTELFGCTQWLIEPTAGGFTIKNVGHGKFLSVPTGQIHDGSQVVATASPFTWVILQNICDGDAVRFVASH